MTTFTDIPLDIILYNLPDLDIRIVCSLIILENKNKNIIDNETLQEYAYASYYKLFPLIVEEYERISKSTFYSIMDNGAINIVKIFDILSKLDNIIHRKKNEQYKFILKPLIDRSLFIKNPYRNNNNYLVNTNTLTFLVNIYYYIQKKYKTPINYTKNKINLWFYIFILDYILLLFEEYHINKQLTPDIELPIILKSQLINIERLINDTKQYSRKLYNSIGDEAKRIIDKIIKFMKIYS